MLQVFPSRTNNIRVENRKVNVNPLSILAVRLTCTASLCLHDSQQLSLRFKSWGENRGKRLASVNAALRAVLPLSSYNYFLRPRRPDQVPFDGVRKLWNHLRQVKGMIPAVWIQVLFCLTVSCRAPSPSTSVSTDDNDVAVQHNASLGIEDVQDILDDSTGRPPACDKHIDESDEEDFTFPDAGTLPTRETPPSPSPQPSKSTLNPAAAPFTFRPAETTKLAEVPRIEVPPELLESTIETAHVHQIADDSDDEEFHFPGAEKLSDPIPAPVPSPSPPEPTKVLSPVPENPLSVGPSSLAATSPAITMPPSPDLGPLSQPPLSMSTPAPAPSTPSPSPLPPPPLKRKPTQVQLEALYAAASSNDLPLLQTLFRNACQNEDVEEFALANDAAVRTGLTALHAAASRGYLEITQWRKFIPLRSDM